MREGPVRSPLVGAFAGVTIVVASALAHVAAGGAVNGRGLLVAAAVAALSGVAIRTHLTLGKLVAIAALTQPVLHAALSHGAASTAIHQHTAGHADHHVSHGGAAGTHGLSMMVAHAVVGVGIALALRWGVRWMRSMPEIGRALVTSGNGVAALIVLPARAVAPVTDAAGTPLAVLPAWRGRGPPR
jgi:hypothetical protein